MNTQPKALRLADWLDGHSNGPMDAKHEAAAELRRLHEANRKLMEAPEHADLRLDGVTAKDDAETYLRRRYGAYRGHFAWRELEEAFNAGKNSK